MQKSIMKVILMKQNKNKRRVSQIRLNSLITYNISHVVY